MYNILLACDLEYYNTWAINCAKSIQRHVPWVDIHIVVVNPNNSYEQLPGVKYYEDRIEFPNETCKIPYYQAVRFLKCAELFANNELVVSIDCDTVCTRSFSQRDFENILSSVHVQRHQKDVRWMAGLVTYGNDMIFRNTFREELLKLPLENWRYGWDQKVLNSLQEKFNYTKLPVGNWMSFGIGNGIFLTLKGAQKTSASYLKVFQDKLSGGK